MKRIEEAPTERVTVTLTPHEAALLEWLAQRSDNPQMGVADLIEAFVADLVGSWRNGGSDEREYAFAWWKRRCFTLDGTPHDYSEATTWHQSTM
jgi:hypothetical protein